MIFGKPLIAAIAGCLLMSGLLVLERVRHDATRAKVDELGRRVIALQTELEHAGAVNGRLAAERTAYQQAQRALAAALEEAERQRKTREAQVRQAKAEATQRDRDRRARPDVPPPEEMADALADAARAL